MLDLDLAGAPGLGVFSVAQLQKCWKYPVHSKRHRESLGGVQLMLILSASALDMKLKSWSPGVVKVPRGTWLRILRQFSDFIGSGTK